MSTAVWVNLERLLSLIGATSDVCRSTRKLDSCASCPIGNLIKFIGIVETRGGRIGAFSDCRYTFSGRDGEVIEGRFRVVKIQVESAIVEYVDGQGRTTLPLNGQACVGK